MKIQSLRKKKNIRNISEFFREFCFRICNFYDDELNNNKGFHRFFYKNESSYAKFANQMTCFQMFCSNHKLKQQKMCPTRKVRKRRTATTENYCRTNNVKNGFSGRTIFHGRCTKYIKRMRYLKRSIMKGFLMIFYHHDNGIRFIIIARTILSKKARFSI